MLVRFSPSPTGLLHVGNARTAVVNFLFAKKSGAKFMLRLDDTDLQRSKQEYVEAIYKDLQWLGIDYDSTFRQSTRLERYAEAAKHLISTGKLYPCYETEEEIELQRKSMLSSGVPPVYSRGALKMSDEQKNKLKASSVKPYYRFKLEHRDTKWLDLIKGDLSYNGKFISDPVLIRANGSPTYTFCSVVDDADFCVSHIIRGEDHVTNTAVQIQIFEAMNVQPPHFAHLALIESSEGKISKRVGGFDIRALKDSGLEPETIVSFLANLGTTQSHNEFQDLHSLIKNFSLDNYGKSATNFSTKELTDLNHRRILALTYDQLLKRTNIKAEHFSAQLFEVIKGNLHVLKDIEYWLRVCSDTSLKFQAEQENISFLQMCADVFPQGEINKETWQTWIDEIKKKDPGRTGKRLFMPIRLALTGTLHGPDLKDLLPLMSKDVVLKRIT